MKRLRFRSIAFIVIGLVVCVGAGQWVYTTFPSEKTPALPSEIHLIRGTYDIPWYIEPDRDIALVRHQINPQRRKSEYTKVNPSDFTGIKSEASPLHALHYLYTPRIEDIEDVVYDKVETTGTMIQVCIAGTTCVRFYMNGEVIALTFADQTEARQYRQDFLKAELGKNKYNGTALREQNGAVFLRDWLVLQQHDQHLFLISSWMPHTLEAILAALQQAH